MPIFDQGYQHWNGTLSGHAWRWATIARHGVRAGMQGRITRTLLLASWVPALGLVFVLCVWGLLERKSSVVEPMLPMLRFLAPEMLADPKGYRIPVWTICYDYFLLTELRFSMILILLIGPNLISGDLRFNALPLYFSRPLRRVDYFVGKLGVIAGFLAMTTILPAVVAYGLGLLFSLDWTIVRDTFKLLLSSVAYGAVIALSAGLLVLALSSLSRNSRYVVLMWLGVWVVTSLLSAMLGEVDQDQRRHAMNVRVTREWQQASPPTTTGSAKLTPAEQARRQRSFQEAHRRARDELHAEELRAARSDWRPVLSYTSNLSRVGRELLGTDAAWRTVATLLPPGRRESFLHQYTGPQHPWQWSAWVLLSLFGLSAWILHVRVKSLDRLR